MDEEEKDADKMTRKGVGDGPTLAKEMEKNEFL